MMTICADCPSAPPLALAPILHLTPAICDTEIVAPLFSCAGEDKEMITDHRSKAFERYWFKELNAAGTGYVMSYQIRWDDGTVRTIRGVA